MNKDFMNIADELRNEYLLKTESLFVRNKHAWFSDFAEHFLAVCDEIQRLQTESDLGSISYLEYTMLYTNFINRQYVTEIRIYGNQSYLDKKQRMVSSYDVSFLFVYFDELWEKLISLQKRFVGQVPSRDVKSFMLGALPDFYSYFTSMARYAIAGCVDQKQFAGITKDELFVVNAGGYMALSSSVYSESKSKDAGELAEWFCEQKGNDYLSGDYSGLDFSECSFQHTNFSYASFRGSVLRQVSFMGSLLEGANFRMADMETCILDNCYIFEADFTDARLQNASFVNVVAKTGLANENKWQHVGFLPASFRNADLTGANFTNANLAGADFSQAILTNTIFTGARLDNSIFSDKNAPLSDEQWNSVVIREPQKTIHGTGKEVTVKKTTITSPIYSSYFVMERLANVPNLPSGNPMEVLRVSDLSRLNHIDYAVQSKPGHIISDRLKQLIELYLPQYEFEPVVYMDSAKPDIIAFWKFEPPVFTSCQASYRRDGYVSHLMPEGLHTPIAFSTRSPKGVRSIVIHMAVAESILRRDIQGLALTRLLEDTIC